MTHTEFNSLSNQEQRVKIAEDVILQIKSKIYEPLTSVYVSFNPAHLRDAGVQKGHNVSETISNMGQCNVCAYGALLLSSIRFKNEVVWNGQIITGSIMKHSSLSVPLEQVFSEFELRKVECAFEGWRLYNYDTWDYTDATKEFYAKYESDTDRLIAIMESIISNEGEFVL